MKATVALFDIDGTLVLTSGAGMRALERAAVEICGVAGATRGIEADGKTDHLLAAEIAAALPPGAVDDGFAERLFAAYVVHLVDEVARSQYRVLPGVEVAIAAAEACVPAVGLATGNIAHAARIKLEPGDLWRRFPFGGFGCDAAERPALVGRAVERAEGRLGRTVPRDEVVVIGDTPRDVHAAHAIGARAVGVATGRYDVDALRATGADWVVETLEELPGLLAR